MHHGYALGLTGLKEKLLLQLLRLQIAVFFAGPLFHSGGGGRGWGTMGFEWEVGTG